MYGNERLPPTPIKAETPTRPPRATWGTFCSKQNPVNKQDDKVMGDADAYTVSYVVKAENSHV